MLQVYAAPKGGACCRPPTTQSQQVTMAKISPDGRQFGSSNAGIRVSGLRAAPCYGWFKPLAIFWRRAPVARAAALVGFKALVQGPLGFQAAADTVTVPEGYRAGDCVPWG